MDKKPPSTLSRREVLLACGAALAAPGSLLARGQDEQVLPLKKAVKYGMVHADLSMLEKFRLLRELGFDGIELPSPNDFDAAEVLRARDAAELPIHGVVDSVHWRDRLSDPDPEVRERGRKALETALRDAKRYGASSVLLVPGRVTREEPYDAVYERSQHEIRKVLPLADELGVSILIENVWNGFLLSPLEFSRYIDELESRRVGAYFDIGNVVKFGFPEQWIRILGRRIHKLDIKDYGAKSGFVKIGDGDVDWRLVREALRAIGYEGWATAEVAGGGRERLAEIASRMDRVLGL